MALPNYIRRQTDLTRRDWRDMGRAERRDTRQQYRPAPTPQPRPQPRRPAPAPRPSGPVVQPAAIYTPPPTEPKPAPPQNTDFTVPGPNPQNGYSGTVPGSQDYANHPFFDPNSSYLVPGERGNIQAGSQWNHDSLGYMNYATSEDPEGYYYALMNRLGLGGFDARSQAGQALYGDYARGYQAAKHTSPDLWFPEYLGGQNIRGLIDTMSYDQLGIDEGNYSARTRWGMRGY